MKRRILVTVCGIIIALGMSSCLDAIEYITLDDGGDIKLSFMITLSRGLVEMGSEGESIEDTFEEEVLDPDELSSMIPGATAVDARPIDSDVDYGYLFTFTIPRGYKPEPETPMAPRFSKNGIEILLGMPDKGEEAEGGEADSDDSMDEMAEAIFSSAKYKIQISKKLLKRASRAYLYNAEGEEFSVDLIDLGDNYLVNLPMLLVMDPEEKTFLVIEY